MSRQNAIDAMDNAQTSTFYLSLPQRWTIRFERLFVHTSSRRSPGWETATIHDGYSLETGGVLAGGMIVYDTTDELRKPGLDQGGSLSNKRHGFLGESSASSRRRVIWDR